MAYQGHARGSMYEFGIGRCLGAPALLRGFDLVSYSFEFVRGGDSVGGWGLVSIKWLSTGKGDWITGGFADVLYGIFSTVDSAAHRWVQGGLCRSKRPKIHAW